MPENELETILQRSDHHEAYTHNPLCSTLNRCVEITVTFYCKLPRQDKETVSFIRSVTSDSSKIEIS